MTDHTVASGEEWRAAQTWIRRHHEDGQEAG